MARRGDIVSNDPSYKGRPSRSFRSTDGGRSWEPVDGEYMIRLQLTQYLEKGELLSPVIDLGKMRGEELMFQLRPS
jgi:hypothetical protein